MLILIPLVFVSCDEEVFGPRTYEGFWDVTENSEVFGDQNFQVWIEESPGDINSLVIYDFAYLEGADVVAEISERNLTIRLQSVVARGGTFHISGNGTATSGLRRIDWQYKIDNDDYTAVFRKQ